MRIETLFVSFVILLLMASSTSAQSLEFLVIDEDSIDNGGPPNFLTDHDVNDDLADVGQRTQLRYFASHIGDTITLYSGQAGDEGWFALQMIPQSWVDAGPTNDGVRNFFGDPGIPAPFDVGPGLGSGSDPEAHRGRG